MDGPVSTRTSVVVLPIPLFAAMGVCVILLVGALYLGKKKRLPKSAVVAFSILFGLGLPGLIGLSFGLPVVDVVTKLSSSGGVEGD